MEITEIIIFSTRMHSSGMRTARLLSAQGGVCPGGVCISFVGGNNIQGGHIPTKIKFPVFPALHIFFQSHSLCSYTIYYYTTYRSIQTTV